MRIAISLLIFGAVLASCGAPAPEAAVSPSAPPTSEEPAAPSPMPSATPSGAPQGATSLQPPRVSVAETFPIVPALALKGAPIDEPVTAAVRISLERYLDQLDRYRDTAPAERNPGMVPVTGRFRDAVAAGIAASATPGVKRKFAIGSFRVDRLLVKPWGTYAVAEVTATILDKAVEGSAPDQTETGRLRLLGDRLFVSDGWDDAGGRWFNGTEAVSADSVRSGVGEAVGLYLRTESWLTGMAPETFVGAGDATPYQKARHAYLGSFDRTKTVSRTFADVTATIDRYETFSEIRDGLAHARVTGMLVTVDAAGSAQRQPFERRVVILFGNWTPEVVDEEIAPGAWRSGGDLALNVRDHNFA